MNTSKTAPKNQKSLTAWGGGDILWTKVLGKLNYYNVKIDPEALHRARVQALIEKKMLAEWLEDAIEEKIAREGRKETG